MRALKFISCLPALIFPFVSATGVYAQSNTSVPKVPNVRVLLPDISKMNFGSLPNFASGGSVNFDSLAQQVLGIPGLSWNAGDAPKDVLKLGFFQDSFNLQQLSLNDIVGTFQQAGSNYLMSQYKVLQKQTIASIVQALPNLSDISAANIPPIAELLTQAGVSDLSLPLSEIMQSYNVGDLSFSNLNLSQYKVGDIPGLDSVQIGALKDWETSSISDIPGLAQLSFTQFPNPMTLRGTGIGQIDVAFSYKESRRSRTISGSDKEGFNVPCDKNCAGFEVTGNTPINGSFWISGKKPAPWVSGGRGILGAVGGGKEPHGRHPFGKAFKVVISDQNEKKGTVDFSAYMRFCKRSLFVDLGCTPYIIGPIPLFPGIKEKTWIPLGASLPTTQPTTNNQYSLNYVSLEQPSPTPTEAPKFDFNSKHFTDNQSLSYLKENKLDCKTRRGMSLSLLTDAIASAEGDYANTGIYTCDTATNCGRNLGIGKFSSNNEIVRKAISTKSGGADFLKKLDKGENITGDELVYFLSPYDQKKILSESLSPVVEVAFNQLRDRQLSLTSSNLAQRVGEIYFAGSAVDISSNILNLKGISPSDFGSNVAKYYESNEYTVDSCNHE